MHTARITVPHLHVLCDVEVRIVVRIVAARHACNAVFGRGPAVAAAMAVARQWRRRSSSSSSKVTSHLSQSRCWRRRWATAMLPHRCARRRRSRRGRHAGTGCRRCSHRQTRRPAARPLRGAGGVLAGRKGVEPTRHSDSSCTPHARAPACDPGLVGPSDSLSATSCAHGGACHSAAAAAAAAEAAAVACHTCARPHAEASGRPPHLVVRLVLHRDRGARRQRLLLQRGACERIPAELGGVKLGGAHAGGSARQQRSGAQ